MFELALEAKIVTQLLKQQFCFYIAVVCFSRKEEHMRRIMMHQLADVVDIVGEDCLFYTEITSTIDAN